MAPTAKKTSQNAFLNLHMFPKVFLSVICEKTARFEFCRQNKPTKMITKQYVFSSNWKQNTNVNHWTAPGKCIYLNTPAASCTPHAKLDWHYFWHIFFVSGEWKVLSQQKANFRIWQLMLRLRKTSTIVLRWTKEMDSFQFTPKSNSNSRPPCKNST